jgi:hypothetical protein
LLLARPRLFEHLLFPKLLFKLARLASDLLSGVLWWRWLLQLRLHEGAKRSEEFVEVAVAGLFEGVRVARRRLLFLRCVARRGCWGARFVRGVGSFGLGPRR